MIGVSGFDWCKEEKIIGLASFTAKILCENHNNSLSDVDTEGKNAFEVFREMRRIENLPVRLRPSYTKPFSINGNLLERWFLKTLINFSFRGSYPIGLETKEIGVPSKELVEIVFGQRTFSGRSGLYFVVRVGQKIESSDKVAFAPLFVQKSYIVGGLFSFRGFRFLLFLNPEGPPTHLDGLGLDRDWSDSQLNYHNQKILITRGKFSFTMVNITW